MMAAAAIAPKQMAILAKINDGCKIVINGVSTIITCDGISENVHPLLMSALLSKSLITNGPDGFDLTDAGRELVGGCAVG